MYKKTLNIFNSNFSLRANLKENELKFQDHWKNIDLLKLINKNKKKKMIFHSGPPYANGNIHIGHSLNSILKDFCFRFYSLNGYKIEYIPGWDTHGLPIATAVIKKRPDFDWKNESIKFREICLEYAKLQVKKQLSQFKRLNLLVDFEKKFLTSDKEYVSSQIEILGELVSKNLIYQNFKPIYWSWSSETALAETEIIYFEKISNSIFIKFLIIESKIKELTNVNLLIWTTTPWTIPENKFLSISKNEKYVLVEYENEKYLISLYFKNKNKKFKNIKILNEYFGYEILDTKYKHPYLEFTSIIYDSDFIKIKEGTGIVHNSPAFGFEDFEIAKKNNIEIKCAINEKGFFNVDSSDKELIGKFYEETNLIVINKLKINNKLFENNKIKHMYPYDWRTKKPVIYRVTKQWYLNLEKIKDKFNEIISQINWIPNWGKKRMLKTVENRKEWCISRQRSWGVPLPIFYDNNGKSILKSELFFQVAKKIKKEGDQIWWKSKVNEILTKEQIKKYNITSKSYDTLDVWFDSGCSSNVLYPNQVIDFICEGNDQFRGWFNSTILINSALNKTRTHKNIIIHGFVNDENGNKMSKSLGNVIDPNEICGTKGADVLRLWVASSNFFDDVNLGSEILNKISKDYVKTRNTIRFLLNNLIDFDPKKDFVSLNELEEIDKLILLRLEKIINDTTKDFSKQKFYISWKKIFFFFVSDLSNNYFDFSKRTLYFEKKNFKRRRKIQTVFYLILKKILIILAPILPHTTEEAYLNFNVIDKKKSIHLEEWPDFKIFNDISLEEKQQKIINWKFINDVKFFSNKIIEKKIKNLEIKSSEEIELIICVKKEYKPFLSKKEIKLYQDFFDIDFINKEDENYLKFIEKINLKEFKNFLKINKITFKNKLEEGYEFNSIIFVFKKIIGKKCKRCWTVFKILENKICFECQENIS